MSQVTKAVILAAGRGTRMKELTDELPKPMVRVKGTPILESIVRGLVANGVERILIVVGWRKEVIFDHFGDGSAFGCVIEYVEQIVQDGTGRVVELAKDFAGNDPFILSYGDILVPAASYALLVDCDSVDGKLTVKIAEDVRKGGHQSSLLTRPSLPSLPAFPVFPAFPACAPAAAPSGCCAWGVLGNSSASPPHSRQVARARSRCRRIVRPGPQGPPSPGCRGRRGPT
jgi:hypothetical protein